MPVFVELDRWVESSPSGLLNGGSAAADAAFELVCLAHRMLVEAGEPVDRVSVSALAGTFAHVVAVVQGQVLERPSGVGVLGPGVHANLRRALVAGLGAFPVPFGEPEPVWDEWVSRLAVRVRSLALVAHGLWSPGVGDRPWEALAVRAVAS